MGDDGFVPASDDSFDRFFLCGWSRKNRYFLEPREGEVETTRNRRRRERKDINIGTELFYFFLMGYSEFVFLIDDEETEFRESDIIGKEAMGSHHNIECPFF